MLQYATGSQGEVPQYYVENSHPAIISPEVFDLVQHEIQRRKNAGHHQSGAGCFSSRIVCGECGSFYGSKVWHSTSKYRRTVWQCNHKFKSGQPCQTPHLYEAQLKQVFVDAFNGLIDNKDEILEGYDAIIKTLTDTSAIDEESEKLQNERDVMLELLRGYMEENAHAALDQKEYQRRYSALMERYETANSKLSKINEQKLERTAKREKISAFLKMLAQSSALLTEFDEELWYATVDTVTVHSAHEITFVWKDGSELPWKI